MNVSIQLHYLALVTPGALLLGTHYSEVFVCKLSHHLSCLKLIKGTGPLGIRCMKSPKPPTHRHQGYSMSPQRPLIILHFTLQLFPVFQLALFNFLFSLFCGFPLKKFIPNSLLIFWDCVWWKKTKEREWEGGIGRQELQGDGRRRAWLLFSELLLLGPASAGVSGRAQPHYAASLWHVPPRRFLPSCGVCFPPEGRKEAHTD